MVHQDLKPRGWQYTAVCPAVDQLFPALLPALATGGKIGLGEVGEPESENGVTVRSQISAIGPHEGYKLGSAVL
jgi:hypothetical protein